MATAQLTTDNDAILAEIFIAAPPVRVFEAITDPKQRAQWWGQKGTFRVTESISDLRVGGKYSNEGVGPNGTPFHLEGKTSRSIRRVFSYTRESPTLSVTSKRSFGGNWNPATFMAYTA